MANTPNLDLEILVGEEVVGVDEWNANWGKIDAFAGLFGDKIEESGTSGAWSFIKLKGGLALCWAQMTLTGSVSAFAGMYTHMYPKQTLPFAFKAEPLTFCSGYAGSVTVVSGRSIADNTSVTPSLSTGASSPVATTVNILCLGSVSV